MLFDEGCGGGGCLFADDAVFGAKWIFNVIESMVMSVDVDGDLRVDFDLDLNASVQHKTMPGLMMRELFTK